MSVYLNGISQTDFGLVLVEGAPAVGGFARERTSLAWAGRAGHIPSTQSTTPPRVLRFVYQGRAGMSLTQRATALRWMAATLTGAVEVRWTDGTSRRLVGICTRNDAAIATPSFVNIAPTLTVEITCYDAAIVDTEMQQFAIGSTPVRMPVGTAGHHCCFVVTGANSTAFTITYRNFAGVAVGAITCTPALAANETLLIDTSTEQFVRYNTSGVGVLVPTWNTTTEWPEFVPRDAQRELGVYGTLEASTAMGCYYRMGWEN